MSIGLKVNDMVPSGMLGTQQWYSQPEMQQQLQLEMEVMKPHVGEIKWGVNVGTLPDGRMYWKIRQPIKAERANGRGTLYNSVYDIMLVYEPDHPKGKWGTSVHASQRDDPMICLELIAKTLGDWMDTVNHRTGK